ncbi:Arsenate reductase [Plasmodiophora brassicae]|uniref:Arsenate reductase n=1 Tax=Plasmodiophora brassicae TaxID=37360 RepID=A0A0G4J6T1_PLABS|nr:hypothetical protein PBRA_003058 [Plasmodiophora brassicae]SPQ95538.1 unnamed protein product [Plasmodiophora brassicae]
MRSAARRIPVTILHWPACSKSRACVDLFAQRLPPTAFAVVDFGADPPPRPTMVDVFDMLSKEDHAAIIRDATEEEKKQGDLALREIAIKHPERMQRPVIVNWNSGTAIIGRPIDRVASVVREIASALETT